MSGFSGKDPIADQMHRIQVLIKKKGKAQKIKRQKLRNPKTQKHRRLQLRSPKTGRAKNIKTRKQGRERIGLRVRIQITRFSQHAKTVEPTRNPRQTELKYQRGN